MLTEWKVIKNYKLYIVEVFCKGERFEYEFSNLEHAQELAASEESYNLYSYGYDGGMTLIETNIEE